MLLFSFLPSIWLLFLFYRAIPLRHLTPSPNHASAHDNFYHQNMISLLFYSADLFSSYSCTSFFACSQVSSRCWMWFSACISSVFLFISVFTLIGVFTRTRCRHLLPSSSIVWGRPWGGREQTVMQEHGTIPYSLFYYYFYTLPSVCLFVCLDSQRKCPKEKEGKKGGRGLIVGAHRHHTNRVQRPKKKKKREGNVDQSFDLGPMGKA